MSPTTIIITFIVFTSILLIMNNNMSHCLAKVERIYELMEKSEKIANRIRRKDEELKMRFHGLLRGLNNWEEGRKVRISPISATDIQLRDVNLKIVKKKEQILAKIELIKKKGISQCHQSWMNIYSQQIVSSMKFLTLEHSVQELQEKIKLMKEEINLLRIPHQDKLPQNYPETTSEVVFIFE